ncbi:MAG: hypothetical protein ACJ8F7_18225 [Gemmataceae bacterium]
MSWLRNLTAFFVAIAGFAVGGVAANYGWQFQAVSQVAGPTPAPATVASLAVKGPGTAVHLDLTDFKFGEPLIEKNGERWECVWLPLLASSGKAAAPVVFFRSTRIRDQEQLDQLRQQKSLQVFVTNTALKKSVWGADMSHELFAKYPKMDYDKLTIVGESELDVPLSRELAGRPRVLATHLFFAPMTRYVAWGIGGGSILIGVVLAILLITPNSRAAITELVCRVKKNDTGMGVTTQYLSCIPAGHARPEELQTEREHLLHEEPLTSHQYSALGMMGAVAGVGLGFLLFLGVFAGVLYASSHAGPEGPAIAGGIGFMAASVFMVFVYFCKRSLDRNGKSVDVIQICTSGLRWQLGRAIRMAAWSEVARVERVTVDVNRKKQAMATQFGLVGALAMSIGSAGDEADLTRQSDTVALQLHTGEVMHFSTNSLSDYVAFARSIHELHGNEARRIAGGGSGDEMIARAVTLPGTSRASMLNYTPRR